jgi:hypothetical protein
VNKNYNVQGGSVFERPGRGFLQDLKEVDEENFCGYMDVSLKA